MLHGTVRPDFAPLRDLLAQNLADGEDDGAAVAVVHDGELVVDLYGGNAAPGQPWTADTLTLVWSVSKVMAALAVLQLADRGELDLEAPVVRYWPAFGAHGKDEVLVRQVLGHTSGVPGWTPAVDGATLIDLEASEALLAAETPWYQPGSAPAYQLIAHGHLLDGIVRGATGRPLAEHLHEKVTGPLGGGFYLGVPAARLADCARLIAPPPPSRDFSTMPGDHFLFRTLLNPPLSMKLVHSQAWRQGAVGGAGGHGNARGIALAQSALSHGGVAAGVRLLSEEIIDRVFEVQATGTDLVLDAEVTYGIGYGLPMASAPAVGEGRVCWWTGYGGAVVVNDLDRRLTVAYTPNKLADHMVSSPRTDGYVATALNCVG